LALDLRLAVPEIYPSVLDNFLLQRGFMRRIAPFYARISRDAVAPD
jgi:hypothetical protein